ncbi:MAG: hypothetical protein OXQ90_10850 [Gammaproteobacteria bacterium]|nr:hypothetical protein [Gammaproteobacteria bacterium]
MAQDDDSGFVLEVRIGGDVGKCHQTGERGRPPGRVARAVRYALGDHVVDRTAGG